MRRLIALFAMLLTCTAVAAADWPQWLGPKRDASTTEKVKAWKEAPKVLWRQDVGEGHSSPVVAGGKVYLLVKVANVEDEQVLAFDAKSGKPLWQSRYPRGKFSSLFGNGPRATPAIDGDRLYSLGATGILRCMDTSRNGRLVWQVNALEEFRAKNLLFGVACSPLITNGKVIISIGGKGASVVAFGKEKGNVVWKNLDDPASYSSPIAAGKGNDRRVVVFTAKGLAALDSKDGKAAWQFPFPDTLLESSATPVVAGDLLIASSITQGTVALRQEKKDGKPAVTKVWKKPELTSYFTTPVPVGKDYLYLVTGTKPPAFSPVADLHCVERKSGKVLWTKKKVGKYHASLLRTGDDKLLMLKEDGELVLIDPSPKEYRELARSKVCGQTWAHPALANGRLYIRDGKELICLQVGEGK